MLHPEVVDGSTANLAGRDSGDSVERHATNFGIGNMTTQSGRLANLAHYRKQESLRQRKARFAARQTILAVKASAGCMRCPEKHPACLQFHHRGVVLKMPIAVIESEMAKCDLLCANCHAKLHWDERQERLAAEESDC